MRISIRVFIHNTVRVGIFWLRHSHSRYTVWCRILFLIYSLRFQWLCWHVIYVASNCISVSFCISRTFLFISAIGIFSLRYIFGLCLRCMRSTSTVIVKLYVWGYGDFTRKRVNSKIPFVIIMLFVWFPHTYWLQEWC